MSYNCKKKIIWKRDFSYKEMLSILYNGKTRMRLKRLKPYHFNNENDYRIFETMLPHINQNVLNYYYFLRNYYISTVYFMYSY